MSTVIDLPNNQHATLSSNEELSNKQVKEIRRAARLVGVVGKKLKDLGLDEVRSDDDATEEATAENAQKAMEILTHLSDDEDDTLDLFQRTCAAVRIVDWTLDLPLPKTPEDVDNLPRPIYAVLTTEAAKLDLSETFDVDGAADLKVHTEESSDSAEPLPDTP